MFILKPVDGSPRNSTGLIDRSLFTGENELHAIMDEQTCLWSLKYKYGKLPGAFKQQFTGFTPLYKFAENYFKSRNIEIVGVQD